MQQHDRVALKANPNRVGTVTKVEDRNGLEVVTVEFDGLGRVVGRYRADELAPAADGQSKAWPPPNLESKASPT
jgi:hypothetical protein